MDDPFIVSFSEEEASDAPSLPVIILSAAFGLAAGAIALYLCYEIFYLIAPISIGLALLAMLSVIGFTASFFSAMAGLRSTFLNVTLSCGLVLFLLIFFGFCVLTGVLFATFLGG